MGNLESGCPIRFRLHQAKLGASEKNDALQFDFYTDPVDLGLWAIRTDGKLESERFSGCPALGITRATFGQRG